MPPPPPPPPPLFSPPPPPPPAGGKCQPQAVDRNALLSSIRQGAKLKKANTNDRSAPVINGKSSNQSGSVNANQTPNNCNNGPIGLGGLFAQGMPKLRSTNQSFLQGGTYKSQLNPRSLTKNESFPKVPSLSSKVQQNSIETSSAVSDDTKSNGSAKPIPENVSTSKRSQPTRPSLQPTIIVRSNVKNIVQKNIDSNKLGGSEPNLSQDVPNKPRSSSKPLPPPRALHSNSATASPVKLNIDLKYRSYEDSDVPSKSDTNIFPKPGNFATLHPQMLNNRSEPSNLNKLDLNGSTQSPVAPARHVNRRDRLVKPSVAPPPLPVRVFSSNTLPTSGRDLPPPPPPPPRVMQQSVPINGRALPAVPRTAPSTNGAHHQQQMTGSSNFESRFKFRLPSEFSRPEVFSNKSKSYPSKIASQQRQRNRKTRQPPPQVPPPPPPIRTG